MSIHTQLYTFLTYDIDFDISLYVNNATSFVDPHVLELGVGLGRTIFPILQKNIPCTGIEKERDFFDELQEYAKNEELNHLNLHFGYMERFGFQQRFSSIHIPLRTFQLLTEAKDRNRCIKNMKHHLRDDGNIVIHLGVPKHRDSLWRTIKMVDMTEDGKMLIEECIQQLDESKFRLLHRFQQFHKEGYCTGTYLMHHELILLSESEICEAMKQHQLVLQQKHILDADNTVFFFVHEG